MVFTEKFVTYFLIIFNWFLTKQIVDGTFCKEIK